VQVPKGFRALFLETCFRALAETNKRNLLKSLLTRDECREEPNRRTVGRGVGRYLKKTPEEGRAHRDQDAWIDGWDAWSGFLQYSLRTLRRKYGASRWLKCTPCQGRFSGAEEEDGEVMIVRIYSLAT
jgi:hypothetical protein